MSSSKCIVPDCDDNSSISAAVNSHKHRAHLFYGLYKCLKCKIIIYHSTKANLELHLKSNLHNVKRNWQNYINHIINHIIVIKCMVKPRNRLVKTFATYPHLNICFDI